MTDRAPIVSGVDFVSVPTTDYERAAAFYGSVLGLPCIETYSRIPGGAVATPAPEWSAPRPGSSATSTASPPT